jgi:NAD(P)-dependent dehydrogenase (short-subunit alcohol dehydrogenase family)
VPLALAVTTAVDEALELAESGGHVVLVVDADASVAAARRLTEVGPGRVHLFVGDVADPSVRQAVEEMAAELGARAN